MLVQFVVLLFSPTSFQKRNHEPDTQSQNNTAFKRNCDVMMDRLIDTVKIEVNPNDGFVVRVIRESAAIITVPWRTE